MYILVQTHKHTKNHNSERSTLTHLCTRSSDVAYAPIDTPHTAHNPCTHLQTLARLRWWVRGIWLLISMRQHHLSCPSEGSNKKAVSCAQTHMCTCSHITHANPQSGTYSCRHTLRCTCTETHSLRDTLTLVLGCPLTHEDTCRPSR